MASEAAHHVAMERRLFARVLCGVDASRADAEAVRQAALLTAPGGVLDLVCVVHHGGYGPNEQATLGRDRADEALVRGRQVATEAGVDATTRVVEDRDRWHGLESAGEGHDLLVVGRHRRSRVEGVIAGSLSTEALHRAEMPVLVAAKADTPFPQRVLLASDGSEDARRAADLATEICAAFQSQATILTVGSDADRAHRHEIAREAADLMAASGVEPVAAMRAGAPRTAIVDFVRQLQPALVIIGSGGKRGVRALGSVSEHVAHHVDCSVLVARAPAATA